MFSCDAELRLFMRAKHQTDLSLKAKKTITQLLSYRMAVSRQRKY